MPTTLYTLVIEDGFDWTHHLSWRVPVNDERHFTVDLIEKVGRNSRPITRAGPSNGGG